MSLGARATKGGAKPGGKEGKHAQDKGKGTEKPQPKEKIKPQATTEQLRMAHMIDRKSEDASDVRRMVLELMEMTCRPEDEVCSALHDTDNDMVAACNLLLEESQRIQGEWQTNEKKKKKPPAPTGNGETEPPPREPRSRSGPRPRRGEGEGGRGRGGGRGGGGARGGGRGGGRGGRRGGGPPRGRSDICWNDNNDNEFQSSNNVGDSFPAAEDWENEEWTGSLSDTKVFTPSTNAQNAVLDSEQLSSQNNTVEDWDTPETNGPTDHIPTYTYHSASHHPTMSPHPTHAAPSHQPTNHHHLMDQMNSSGNHTSVPVSAAAKSEPNPMETYHQTPHHQPMGMSGSLSAAQSQYLSQLTQQSQRHDPSVYTANYGVYGSTDMSNQRKPQRARVPPPSKIPSSAVEMPGGEGGMFLDVQFGALEPEALQEAPPTPTPTTPTPTPPVPTVPAPAPKQVQVTSQPEPQPLQPSHETSTDTPSSYPNTNSMLSESLSVVDSTSTSQPVVASEPTVTNTASLEKQLTASMKQLSASGVEATPAQHPPAQPHAYAHHRPKAANQQNVYAHHAVSHHPPVYGANVYAPQVNSTNASLTGASAMTGMTAAAYATSGLTQYQPIINSYQQTSSSAGVYGGSALYTAYQPTPQAKMQPKDTQQYDNSAASSNSLTSTSTTQTSTAKVATTTGHAGATSVAGATATAGAGYAGGALYGATGAYAAYDEQMMRTQLPHHMGGYYEVGYGVSGAREGTFGLGAGERFGRTDAASPQQVPAALPPGYAYFYQPPPTTYQYGVYPTYGGGSNVGGVGGVSGGAGGKVSTYGQQQQPPYDAQDTYKPGGPYNATANKTAGGATADLTNAMYAKTHVALNKVNSYEKASFHSGTPPPFGAGSHLYIPAPPHHLPHHHQVTPQQHQIQMDVRVNSNHNRRQENAGGGRNASAKPAANKPNYSQPSYWPGN